MEQREPAIYKYDEEKTLPRGKSLSLTAATLIALIKEALPPEAKISSQANELLGRLSMHFLTHLSDQANVICNEDNKKTINPSHVNQALKKMKLDAYLQQIYELEEGAAVDLNHKKTREAISQKINKEKRPKKKLPVETDKTEEELRLEQEELFRNAANGNYSDPEGNIDYPGAQYWGEEGQFAQPSALEMHKFQSMPVPQISMNILNLPPKPLYPPKNEEERDLIAEMDFDADDDEEEVEQQKKKEEGGGDTKGGESA